MAPQGNDTNPGTVNQPLQTFRAAITIAGPGDVIYARGGTYGYENAMTTAIWSANGDSCGPDQYDPIEGLPEQQGSI